MRRRSVGLARHRLASRPAAQPLTGTRGKRQTVAAGISSDPLLTIPVVRVVLRPEQPSDLALLTGGESPFDEFGPKAVRAAVRPSQLENAGGLAVVDDTGTLSGDVSWHWVHWGPTAGSRCPNIGIWLRPTARGRGIGAAAQRTLAQLFFAHTTVNRVEAHTDVENLAEQRALERAGFTREGLIRGAQWRDGSYRDGYLYAVLRHELAGSESAADS